MRGRFWRSSLDVSISRTPRAGRAFGTAAGPDGQGGEPVTPAIARIGARGWRSGRTDRAGCNPAAHRLRQHLRPPACRRVGSPSRDVDSPGPGCEPVAADPTGCRREPRSGSGRGLPGSCRGVGCHQIRDAPAAGPSRARAARSGARRATARRLAGGVVERRPRGGVSSGTVCNPTQASSRQIPADEVP